MSNHVSPAIIRQAEINYRNDYLDPKNPHPGETLLETLDYCFKAGISVPQWAQDEYRKCYKKYQSLEGIDPLVRAFRTDKHASKPSKRNMEKHLTTVCHTIRHLIVNGENGVPMPIGEGLFTEVAKRHGNVKGLSASTIEKEYYPILKQAVEYLEGLGIEYCVVPGFRKISS